MWGDWTLWDGSKEVVILHWWERLWRWVRRRNSKAAYERAARTMEAANGRTRGGDGGGGQDGAGHLRDLTRGQDASVCDEAGGRAAEYTYYPVTGGRITCNPPTHFIYERPSGVEGGSG